MQEHLFRSDVSSQDTPRPFKIAHFSSSRAISEAGNSGAESAPINAWY
jgi:hypothetical protein